MLSWLGHVWRMREIKIAFRILVGKHEPMRPLRRLGVIWRIIKWMLGMWDKRAGIGFGWLRIRTR